MGTTKYMQKYRTDDDYKYKEERLRRINQISKGVIPRVGTLQKYGITATMVNKIRFDAGLPKIDTVKFDVDPIRSTQTVALEINKDTKEEIERIERERTYKLNEAKQKLTDEQNKIKEKYKGKIVHVPQKGLFSVEQIMNYYTKNEFRMPNNVPKSETLMKNKYGIILTYDTAKRNAKSKIVSGKYNGKGTFTNMIKAWNPECLKDFSKCLKHIDEFIEFVKTSKQTNGEDYTAVSRQSWLETLNPILKDYPAFNDISEARDVAVQKIDKALATHFKSSSEAYKLTKQANEKIDSWTTIKNKIEDTFPIGTLEYLYINIFEQVPSRDDLANLAIYDYSGILSADDLDNDNKHVELKEDIKRFADNGKTNVVILHRTGAIFGFFKYKTDQLYGDQWVDADKNIRKLIDDYVANGLFELRLFESNSYKMSQWVGSMLKKAGLKDDATVNKGAINLLRKALITFKTEELEKLGDITESDRIKMAKLLRHSVAVTPKYLRKLLPTYEKLKEDVKKKLDEAADDDTPLALPAPEIRKSTRIRQYLN